MLFSVRSILACLASAARVLVVAGMLMILRLRLHINLLCTRCDGLCCCGGHHLSAVRLDSLSGGSHDSCSRSYHVSVTVNYYVSLCHCCACANNCDCDQAENILCHNCILL